MRNSPRTGKKKQIAAQQSSNAKKNNELNPSKQLSSEFLLMEEEMTQLRQNKPTAIEENTAQGAQVAPDLNSKA